MTDNKTEIQRKLHTLCAQFGIDILYVFGSRAREIDGLLRGEERKPGPRGADVDLGIVPAEKRRIDLREQVKFTKVMEDLLQVDRVDLIILPAVSPFLAIEAIRGELLYAADGLREAEYELYILRQVGDMAHFERERRKQILDEGSR